MNDPAVASDSNRIIALSKEHASLGKIVGPYREYRKIIEEYHGAQDILENETDEELRAMASGEIEDLKHQAEDALDVVKGLLVMSSDQEIGSVILEVRAGTGGDEAALFCGNLLDMYRAYAERHGWSSKSSPPTPRNSAASAKSS